MKSNEKFIRLFESYSSKVFFTILGIVKDKQDAEDIFQDTALKAYKSFNKLKDTNSFNTWIIKIAINNSYDYIKRNRLTYNIDELQIPYYDNYGYKDEILLDALNMLSSDERIVVILKVYDEMSYKEISKIVDRPINTLKSVYTRSLIKLKKYLESKNYFK